MEAKTAESYSVLLFDDEEVWTDVTKEYIQLGGRAVRVDVAHTAEEATAFVRNHSYNSVLVDVDLGPHSKITGDQWILENYDHLDQVDVLATVTAYEGRIRSEDDLAERNVRVVQKSEEEETALIDSIKEQIPDLQIEKVEPAAEPFTGKEVATFLGEVTETGVGPDQDAARVTFWREDHREGAFSRLVPLRRLEAIGADFVSAKLRHIVLEDKGDSLSRFVFEGPSRDEIRQMRPYRISDELLEKLDRKA